jgi:hypothetical protein
MFNEDGGVCTVSSSVRRTRSSRAVFAGPAAARFGDRADAVRLRVPALVARAATRFLADFFRLAAFFFGCRLVAGRLAERRAELRFRADLRGLGRRAAGRFAMAKSPFEP